MFILLFLARLICENQLIENLDLIQPNKAKPFVLQRGQPTNPFPIKQLSQEFNIDAKDKIPLPISGDPFIVLEFDFFFDELKEYKFELYKFYKKIKY